MLHQRKCRNKSVRRAAKRAIRWKNDRRVTMVTKKIGRMEEKKLYHQIFASLCTNEKERLALYNALSGTTETDADRIGLKFETEGAVLFKEGGAEFRFSLAGSNLSESEFPERISGCA